MIPIGKKIKSDFHLIKNNYKILHFDEEPILFSGTNEFGNRILASSVDEDYDAKKQRYFYSIISPKDYGEFLHKKISYLDVLRKMQSLYVVDESFDASERENSIIDFDDIPREYLPAADSFCPNLFLTPSFSYKLGLKGKLADVYKAIPEDLSKVQVAFANLMKSSIKKLKGFVEPSISIGATGEAAYLQGSFKINFDIDFGNEIDEELKLFPEYRNEFIKNFIDYCINHLPDEVDKIYSGTEYEGLEFNNLLKKCGELYDQSKAKKPDSLKDILLTAIKTAADEIEELSGNIGEHFSSIEIANMEADVESPIGLIDAIYKTAIERTVDTIDELTLKDKVMVDPEPKEYSVQIYHLNTETRKGNALVKDSENEKFNYRPRITIKGDSSLEESIYSESLYKNMWIDVKGKAKKVGSKVKSIEIIPD